MRRALRKAGWALAAAGGISVAAPAEAQTPTMQVIGPVGHVEQPGDVIVMTEGQARLEEGQVELSLLADPMLFSYGLGAHVQGPAIELRGFVPTADVRDQALKVAREHTALHVIDRLKLAPNLATRCSIDKPENIQRAAKELLEEVSPVHGRTMDVKCDARGRVTITGRVATFEDRLLASRKLRQVSGCSCVVNQLEVAQAKPVTQPTHATVPVVVPHTPPVTTPPAVTHWEPVAPPVPARTVATPPKVTKDPPPLGVPRIQSEPVAPPPVSPVILPSVPPLPRPVTPAAPKGTDLPTLPMPRVHQDPVSLPPAPAPAVKPLPELPSIPKPATTSVIDITPTRAKPDSLPKLPTPSADKDALHGSGTGGTAILNLSPVDHPKPAPAVKLPEVVNQPPATSSKPLPLPPVVPLSPAKSQPKAPAVDKHDKGGSEVSYVSEGTITLDDEPPATKTVGATKKVTPPPAPKVTPMPPSKLATDPVKPSVPPAPERAKVPPLPPIKPTTDWGKPSATDTKAPSTSLKSVEGTMSLTPPPMPPSKRATDPMKVSVPPMKPPAPLAPERANVPPAVRLKERIQGLCGPAYEVKVAAHGKNDLRLEITSPVSGEELAIMRRIKPIIDSAEFHEVAIDVDVITPAK